MASSELLKQIQAGKRLKKAETNDRSAPAIDPKPSGAGAGARAPMSAPAIPSGGGPPQLGGLFAGGVPKLKPAGQGNLAKAPTLGKPPTVPGRAPPSSLPSAPPPPSRATPKPSTPAPASAPPTRSAPTLPSRAPIIPPRAPLAARVTPSPPPAPPAPAPPRRPIPPPRAASPPSSQIHPSPPVRAPPTAVVRSSSPADTQTTPVRAPPPPPTRPGNAVPIPPARKAPPPPARPSSVGGSSRVAPPPPARKTPVTNGPPALPVHVRALSETESSTPSLPSGPPPRANLLSPGAPPPTGFQRPRVVSTPPSEVPPQPSMAFQNGRANGTRRAAPTRKIPSPPPEAGSHRFPTSDFPPPREFTPEPKLYGGGRQRGSDFDLSNI